MKKENYKRSYGDAIDNSIHSNNDEPIKYGKKNSKRKPLVRLALITLGVVSVITLGGIGTKIAHNLGEIWSINREADDKIDGRIRFFINLLDGKYEADWSYDPTTYVFADKNELYQNIDKIQRIITRDKFGHTLYNYGFDAPRTIAKLLAAAAQCSEQEFRCAVLGAYNSIVEYTDGLREGILNSAFSKLSRDEEAKVNASEEIKFVFNGTLDDYVRSLGYTDYKDFVMNERNNLKEEVVKEIAKGKNK